MIVNIFKNILDYLNYVKDSIQDFYDLVIAIFNLIPSPFKEMLTAALIGFVIIIILKIKEKFL